LQLNLFSKDNPMTELTEEMRKDGWRPIAEAIKTINTNIWCETMIFTAAGTWFKHNAPTMLEIVECIQDKSFFFRRLAPASDITISRADARALATSFNIVSQSKSNRDNVKAVQAAQARLRAQLEGKA
jgi:hypothetical protein